ncbi:MAG: phosphohistidine phosphatase SixA [Burkholderiaceae bacterium]
MDLILWRHAEAFDAGDGQDDLSRGLTPKGERHAQRMAQWLNRRIAETTRVLVSPALRCQQTAAALEKKAKTLPELAPGVDVQLLLDAARWPDSSTPVLLVGHQPTLGMLAATLLTGTPHALSVKKGCVWWLRSRDREGLADVTLYAVQSPDNC